MRNDREVVGAIIGLSVIVCLLILVATMKINVWNECRIDHSWWYCLHLINGR